MRTGVAGAALVLSLLAVAACGGGEPDAAKASRGSPQEAIAGFGAEPANVEASFASLHEHARERPGELRAAALEHAGADAAGVRYGSLYALALTAEEGESLAALRSGLESDDVSERMLAAGTLVARGEKDSLPALIDALAVDEELRFRDSPKQAWQVARFLLVQYTGEDLGLIGKDLDAAKAAAVRERWQAWWRKNGSSLRWDPGAARYR